VLSTKLVRQELERNGIPCLNGNAAGFTFIDLAAWGCVPIEAKRAVANQGCSNAGATAFSWMFSHRQAREWFPEETIIVFMAVYEDKERYFVVPSTESFLRLQRRKGGRRKVDVSGPKRTLFAIDGQSANQSICGVENWENLERFENRFDLIEQARVRYSAELMKNET
jgi:hypothetical protein